MRAYITALFAAAAVSFVTGTGWYTLFGYDPYVSAPENVIAIYSSPAFWRGFLVWTVLYLLFVTLPVAYFKNKAT